MKYSVFILIILFIFSGSQSFAYNLDARLKNGEILIEDAVGTDAKAGSVKMSFIVRSDPEKVWELLVRYDKWPGFMPDLDKVIIRSQSEKGAVVYVKAKAPMNLDISYVLKRVYDKENYRVSWTMLEGKAKEMQGSWQIFPVNDQICKVVYTNYLDLGFMVPQNIVNMLTKNKLPAVAHEMRKFLANEK